MTNDNRGWIHLLMLTMALAAALTTLLYGASSADALPIYAARAGRTCDNCHSLPNTWNDPEEFWKRKCTLSCMACHVDPNGGGLRTVSGRYYGLNTLPMYNAEARPLDDKSVEETRKWLESLGRDPDQEPTSAPSSTPTSDQAAKPGSTPTSDQAFGGNPVVADGQVDPRPPGSPVPNEGPVFFRPLLHGSSEMSWLDGRYGNLNADPMIQIGGDARLAVWSPGLLVFPMQADLHLALQPIEHLTIASTTGLRGRSGGFSETANEEVPIAIRDLWIMTHEWPMMSYARAGLFMPGFGTRTADHTSYIRRAFDLTQEDPTDRVVGAEIGMAPNYPYFNAALFKHAGTDQINPLDTGEGFGGTVNFGWRDLGWQLGAGYMRRVRPLDEGGNTEDFSVQWGFNPWFYWEDVPLTYIGELTFGLRERPLSGQDTYQLASFHELAWTVSNGIIMRGRYDFWDPDQEVEDDEINRPGVGVDITWIPGLTTGMDIRAGIPSGGEPNVDAILQVHGWF